MSGGGEERGRVWEDVGEERVLKWEGEGEDSGRGCVCEGRGRVRDGGGEERRRVWEVGARGEWEGGVEARPLCLAVWGGGGGDRDGVLWRREPMLLRLELRRGSPTVTISWTAWDEPSGEGRGLEPGERWQGG